MNEKINFPETVMIIDAVFLNKLITDFKKNFEKLLQRPLPAMDMSHFITCMALDSSLSEGKNSVQILLIHDESTSKLTFCQPSSLRDELNGVAFHNHLGEFLFASISPEGMVSREELYMDLLNIVIDSADVTKIIALPSDEAYKSNVFAALQEAKKKDVVVFSMEKPEYETSYQWQMLAYPVMQALGIKGDELS